MKKILLAVLVLVMLAGAALAVFVTLIIVGLKKAPAGPEAGEGSGRNIDYAKIFPSWKADSRSLGSWWILWPAVLIQQAPNISIRLAG